MVKYESLLCVNDVNCYWQWAAWERQVTRTALHYIRAGDAGWCDVLQVRSGTAGACLSVTSTSSISTTAATAVAHGSFLTVISLIDLFTWHVSLISHKWSHFCIYSSISVHFIQSASCLSSPRDKRFSIWFD